VIRGPTRIILFGNSEADRSSGGDARPEIRPAARIGDTSHRDTRGSPLIDSGYRACTRVTYKHRSIRRDRRIDWISLTRLAAADDDDERINSTGVHERARANRGRDDI